MTEELKQTWKGLTRPQKIAVLKQAEIGECIAPRELDRYIWVEAIRCLKAFGLARVAFIEGGECEAISLTSKGKELLCQIECNATNTATPKHSTPRAKKAFQEALKARFMEKTATGYKWLYNSGSKVSLAYFLVNVYNPDGAGETLFKELGFLFGVKRLDSFADKAFNVKKPQPWRERIDELLQTL